MLNFSATPLHALEFVAHRGASKDAPENTIPAAELAYKQGADGVECDIYLTKDDQIAVIHDATTKRTTGVDGKVMEMTLADIQLLDAGFKDASFKGTRIPSLDQLLAAVPDGKRLIVELKGGKELIPALKRVIPAAKKKSDQIQFISFKFDALVEVKKEFPEHQALLLLGYDKNKETGQPKLTIDDAIAKAKSGNLDGLSLSIAWPIDDAFVQKVKSANQKLWVWTVNDPAQGKKLVAAGIEVICTDRPGGLRKELAP